MPIEANVTNQQITAIVGETKIDVSVSGGVGPTGATGAQGPQGTSGASSWDDISGKPLTFTPSSHTHDASAITSGTVSSTRLPIATTTTRGAVRLGDGFIVHPTTGAISVSTDYAATGHSHAIADVTGLQAALDGKQASGSCAAAVHSHTIQEVVDLEPELNARVTVDDHRLEDAREWSAATVTQADAEAGTSTTRVAFTPLRVFQAVAAWWSGVSVPWEKLTGVPATFTPTSHTHDASAITAGTLSAARLPASVVQTVDGIVASTTNFSGINNVGAVTIYEEQVGAGGLLSIGFDGIQFSDLSFQSTAWTGSIAASAVTSGTLDIARLPSGVLTTASSIGWSQVSSTPTTRSGYGITDAQKTITSGTAAPTGGSDGDIYLQYT